VPAIGASGVIANGATAIIASEKGPPPPPEGTAQGTAQRSREGAGDANADWLAYGLEDALSERPEIGIVRKHRTDSGLIRYDQRRDLEWPQIAREIIAAEKPNLVVMMIETTIVRASARRLRLRRQRTRSRCSRPHQSHRTKVRGRPLG